MATLTIRDVAARAQVSQATVSRVLNNNPTVDKTLRTRVLDAIQALGYQPNRAARRLRAQSSNVLGLIISDIQNPYFISVIGGVEDAARAGQMSIVFCNSNEDPGTQQRHLQVLESERVGGLIIVPASSSDSAGLQSLMQAGIPVVVLDRLVDNLTTDAVIVDNRGGAYNAVRHLTGLGYRRIGVINGPFDVTTGRERDQGYRQALADAGLPLDEALCKQGDYRVDSGYRLAHGLLDMPQPPDALFVANNLMTLGALRALRERNVRVPQEMPLVGFDDMPWSGELYSPLTAVSQPTYELGQEAVRLLQRRLADPNAPYRTVVLQTKLIVRESCGARLVRRSK